MSNQLFQLMSRSFGTLGPLTLKTRLLSGLAGEKPLPLDDWKTKEDVVEKVVSVCNEFDRIKECERFGQVKITGETDLQSELRMDSLDHIELIVKIEDAFGIDIKDEKFDTLRRPVDFASEVWSAREKLLRQPR
ncbi:hypothetical protein ACOME3_005137 [Neoechinorhynchus agilis]